MFETDQRNKEVSQDSTIETQSRPSKRHRIQKSTQTNHCNDIHVSATTSCNVL